MRLARYLGRGLCSPSDTLRAIVAYSPKLIQDVVVNGGFDNVLHPSFE